MAEKVKVNDDDAAATVFVFGKKAQAEKLQGKDIKPNSKKPKNWSAEETS